MKYKNIGIVADSQKTARETSKRLVKKYKFIELDSNNPAQGKDIDLIIALGGDGFMLHTLHDYMAWKLPVYGMNCGTVGFLMNENREGGLMQRLEEAKITAIHPLRMLATDKNGDSHEALAINEVSLLRGSGQAARIRISVDDTVYLKELVADGVLVSTPAGSSAYNFSINGPILPLKSNLLALSPISPFRPRRWRGALLPHDVVVKFDIITHQKRPVNATADYVDIKNITSVEIHEDRSKTIRLLFDPGHSLEERIIKEQFIQ